MFKEFSVNLKSVIHADINGILNNINSSNIYAIAMTTDSEFSTIDLCVGTIGFLENYATNKTFKSMEYFSSIVWNPDEWDYSLDMRNSQLRTIFNQLDELYNADGGLESFEAYKKEMERIFINSMTDITLPNDNIFLFVCDTDPNDEYLPNKSSSILNSEYLHSLFLQKYSLNFDFYPKLNFEEKKKRFLP